MTNLGYDRSKSSETTFINVEQDRISTVEVVSERLFGGPFRYSIMLGLADQRIIDELSRIEDKKIDLPLYRADLGHVMESTFFAGDLTFKNMRSTVIRKFGCHPVGVWEIRTERDLKKISKSFLSIMEYWKVFAPEESLLEFFRDLPLDVDRNYGSFLRRAMIISSLLLGCRKRAAEILAASKNDERDIEWFERYKVIVEV